MNDDIAIKVQDVYKDFYLPHEKSNSIKTKIVRAFDKKEGEADIQHVLRGISFEVKKGEFFGIVGRNGSGKSTLLKIISEIYKPTKGSIQVNGRLVPFIELGVGFNPELTGRENVYLNGALLGFTRAEIDKQYKEIVEFAELNDFMDQKLKNYSSGMQVRLAFSLAIKARGDILILDEVLAVGDEAFQRKCNKYFYKAKREGKTIILVTHSMENVRQFCDRAILVENGLIIHEGNPDKIANEYSGLFSNNITHNNKNKTITEAINKQNQVINLEDIWLEQSNQRVDKLRFRQNFILHIKFNSPKAIPGAALGVHLVDEVGRSILRFSTNIIEGYNIYRGNNNIAFRIQNILPEGMFYFNIAIENKEDGSLLLQQQELLHFYVVGIDSKRYSKYSMVHPDIEVVLPER